MTTEPKVICAVAALLLSACASAQRAPVPPPSSYEPMPVAAAAAPEPQMSDEALVAHCHERELVLRPKERVQCAAAADRIRAKQAPPAPPPPPVPTIAETKPTPVAPPPPSDPAADEAAARVLYEDGLKLMDEKSYAKACPKLAESHRLKPNVNVQFFLADCYEQTGRTASAWLHFSGAASRAKMSGQTSKFEQASKRAGALEPKLIRVSVKVVEEVVGLEIRRSGVLVTKPQWDSAIPVDPGEIEIAATAPNKKPFTTRIKASTPGTLIVAVPRLDNK